MKRNKILTAFLTLFLSFSLSHEIEAHVYLDYPTGGETFVHGDVVTIQWTIAVPHVTLNWDLFYSIDSGENWDTLQMDIPTEQLTYQWLIPSINTTTARIRIFMDNEGQDYLDISNDFSLVPNTSPPSLDAPAMDLALACGSPTLETDLMSWLDNHGGAEATNFCGTLSWSHDFDGISDDCGETGSVIVQFVAEDSCGSVVTHATVTVQDQQSPVIVEEPVSIVVECDGQGNLSALNEWLNNRGGAESMDECSAVSWSNNFNALNDDCGNTGSTAVVFRVIDACGNSAEAEASFTIVDLTPPVLIQPSLDTTITCGDPDQEVVIQQWLQRQGGASAYDECGGISWSYGSLNIPDSCEAAGNYPVVFTATDECLNVIQTAATLHILGASAVNDNDRIIHLILYPNPAGEVLYLNFADGPQYREIMIIDHVGRIQWHGVFAEQTGMIHLQDFVPGFYYVVVTEKLRTGVASFMKRI